MQKWENLDNKLEILRNYHIIKLSNYLIELQNLEMTPTPIQSTMERKLVN